MSEKFFYFGYGLTLFSILYGASMYYIYPFWGKINPDNQKLNDDEFAKKRRWVALNSFFIPFLFSLFIWAIYLVLLFLE